MDIVLLVIGKTTDKNIVALCDDYQKRLVKYCSFKYLFIAGTKGIENPRIQTDQENILFQKQLKPSDTIILLDETGVQSDSRGFSKFMEKRIVESRGRIVFIIGGAFGFNEEMKKKASFTVSLSKMTFNHQMVRLIFMEQLYRAFSILNNEPYHH